MPQVTYERSALYSEIWEHPMTTVAKRYGVSDVALKKICVKLGVPTPPVGYWARKAAGQAVAKPKLPTLKSGESASCTGHGGTPTSHPNGPDSYGPLTEADIGVQREEDPAWAITVPDQIDSPHPLLAFSREQFAKQHPKGIGAVPIGGVFPSEAPVSSTALDRAVRILDTLAKALERRGGSLGITHNKHSYTSTSSAIMTVLGQPIPFTISEDLEWKSIPLTPAQERENARSPYPKHRPEQVQVGTGRLKLKLDPHMSWDSGIRCGFNDARTQRVEHCLNQLMVSLWRFAERDKARAWEAEQKKLAEQRAEAENQRRQAMIVAERLRRADLGIRIRRHAEAHAIREFLGQLPAPTDPSMQAWHAWATAHADRLERSAVTIKASALIAERDEQVEALDDLPEPPARTERTAPSPAWQYAEPTVPASAFWAVANRHR